MVGPTAEVFSVFLRLGLTSFGGPVAHLGYFREEFVRRRSWLSDDEYADLVALCQFLPGPASSQVGMAIGLRRAGLPGLLAAWAGFTLPSAVLLVGFAACLTALTGVGTGWIGGLKAAAVAVVAQAVLAMARSLAPDAPRATIAAAALILVLLVPGPWTQVLAIILAGVIGRSWLRPQARHRAAASSPAAPPLSRRWGVVCLTTFGALLVTLPLLAAATDSGTLRMVDVFYRSGALVFGGGHVVLPLLEAQLVPTRLVSHDTFLAGYVAAQAVPGPLFTFAAFLGAVWSGSPTGLTGAVVALLAMFLPAALLVLGALPFWLRMLGSASTRAAMAGVNAGVVGILGAALYDPVFTQGITSPVMMALAVAAFVALSQWRVPPWAVVVVSGLAGLMVS